MKRVVEAFHVAKGSEKAAGLLQVVLVVAVVVGTLGITKLLRLSADAGPGFSANQPGLVVDVIKPGAETYIPTRQITGSVTARAPVTISPQVSGRVVSVSKELEAGGTFEPGQILFEIESIDYQLALENAEAEVAAAEAELLQTRATAENFTKDWYRVFPDKPAPALVAKEPQVQALEARLKAAKAGAAQARLNLGRTKFHLDFPARLVESNIERGQLVAAGGAYGTLYATDSLRVVAPIDPKDWARLGLDIGSPVKLRSEADPTRAVTAKVTELGGALDTRTRLQDLTIALPDAAGLVPGTFVTVGLTGRPQESIYRLPLSALATASTVWTVKGGKLLETPVDIVDMTNNYVYARSFDVSDGVVISEVPTSFVTRPVTVRSVISTPSTGASQ